MNKKLILSALLTLTMNQQLFAMTLSEANQLALQNDPNWKAAQQRYDAQKQNLGIARSSMRTQVSVNGNAGQVYGPSIGGAGQTRTGVSLDVTKQLYNSSEKAKIEKARVMQDVYETELEMAMESELIKVTTAYLQALEKHEQYSLGQKESAVMQKYAEQAKNGASVGVTPKNQELDFKAQLDAILTNLLSTEMEVNTAKADLENVVGAPVNSLDSNLALSPDVNTDKQYWLELASSNNLKLQQLKFLVTASDYNVKEKARMYRPVVSAVGSVGYSGGSNFNGNTGTGGYVGIQVHIPLGGRAKSAQTAQARSEQSAAEYDLQAQQQLIQSKVNSLINSLGLDLRIIAGKKQAIKSASDALKTTQQTFAAGQMGSLDMLTAHKNYYSAKKELITAKYQAAGRVLQLLQVSGQLTVDNIERVQRLMD